MFKVTTDLLDSIIDDRCLATRLESTQIDTIKAKLKAVVATMAAACEASEESHYLTVKEGDAQAKYSLHDYGLAPEFLIFAAPRAIKYECSYEWANLKEGSVFENLGVALNPDSFRSYQSVVLAAFGKSASFTSNLEDATSTQSVVSCKNCYVDGERVIVAGDVKRVPVSIKKGVFAENYYPASRSSEAFAAVFSELFGNTFVTNPGLTKAANASPESPKPAPRASKGNVKTKK